MAASQYSTFRVSSRSPVRVVLSFPTIKPADQKERSEEAEVTGIAKYFTAKPETAGKLFLFASQQFAN